MSGSDYWEPVLSVAIPGCTLQARHNFFVADLIEVPVVGTDRVKEVEGVRDVTLSLPRLVGGRGIIGALSLPLDAGEQAQFKASASSWGGVSATDCRAFTKGFYETTVLETAHRDCDPEVDQSGTLTQRNP